MYLENRPYYLQQTEEQFEQQWQPHIFRDLQQQHIWYWLLTMYHNTLTDFTTFTSNMYHIHPPTITSSLTSSASKQYPTCWVSITSNSKRQKRIKTPKREETTRKHNRQENKRNNQTREEEERREKEDGFLRISWLWKAPNLGLSIPQNNPSENSIGRNTRQQSICEAKLWWLCKLIASSMQ